MVKRQLSLIMFIGLALLLLTVPARAALDNDADLDEICDGTNIIDYAMQDNLLTLDPYLRVEEEGDGTINFYHYLDVNFVSAPGDVENLIIYTSFKNEQNELKRQDWTEVSATEYRVKIAHPDFAALGCKKTESGFKEVTYDCDFYVRFYNDCEKNVMKNSIFGFKVIEDQSNMKGTFGIVANSVNVEEEDCDTDCSTSVAYEATVDVYDDESYNDVQTKPVYDVGDFVYVEFKTKQSTYRSIRMTSLKEILDNGQYNEVLHHRDTVLTYPNPGSVHIKARILMSQSFTLYLEGFLENPEDPEQADARILVTGTIDETTSRRMLAADSIPFYYAGIYIEVTPTPDGNSVSVAGVNNDDDILPNPNGGSKDEEPYKFALFGLIALLVVGGALFGYYKYHVKKTKTKKMRVTRRRQMMA